jgi:uncharacterized protein
VKRKGSYHSQQKRNKDSFLFMVIAIGLMLAIYFIAEQFPQSKPKNPVTEKTIVLPDPAPASPAPQNQNQKAKIVIVIDDMGVNVRDSREVLRRLPSSITLAFLPYGQQQTDILSQAVAQGFDIILHQPMQPLGNENAGENILEVQDAPEILVQKLNANLAKVPMARGLNNHMGSRFTQDEEGLFILMDFLQTHNLYFLDSLTTPKSKAAQMARQKNIPVRVRDVFLDDTATLEHTRFQLHQLKQIATQNGLAIAIGHPKETTLQAVEEFIKSLENNPTIEIIPLSKTMDSY